MSAGLNACSCQMPVKWYKGHTEGEDVYAAFGQAFGGRHMAVFFIYKPATTTAVIISARDVSDKERRSYGRK